jgi:RNA polymerase sigma-70 factor (ECF subfamily)
VAKATENKISDRELVAAMANGDADALRALSSRYARMLGALAYRFVQNESDAEEIAADALWQAWREATSFDASRSSVSAWLVMLGRSRAIDKFRAARARRPPENPEPRKILSLIPSRPPMRSRSWKGQSAPRS